MVLASVLGIFLGGYALRICIGFSPVLSIGSIVAFVIAWLVTSKLRKKRKWISKALIVLLTKALIVLLICAMVASVGLGIKNYTPQYYTNNYNRYVRYNHEYYIYDDYLWRVLNNEEIPENLSPISSDSIPFTEDFTQSSYYTSWKDNIDFDSSSNDNDYDWGGKDSWTVDTRIGILTGEKDMEIHVFF